MNLILTDLSLDVMKAQERLLDATTITNPDEMTDKVKANLRYLVQSEAMLNKFQQLVTSQNNVPQTPTDNGANS